VPFPNTWTHGHGADPSVHWAAVVFGMTLAFADSEAAINGRATTAAATTIIRFANRTLRYLLRHADICVFTDIT
jgi:hypothetical protein